MKALFAALVLTTTLLGPSYSSEHRFYAIDGDTIARGSERIRIIGLDTPETYAPKCSAEADLGNRATGRLQHILNTRKIEVQRTGKRDKYRRMLARVFAGGVNVADIMISEGLARPNFGEKRLSWCP